jgi:hypothetical protein
MSTTQSPRKPFRIGARVMRAVDSTTGTVETVQPFSVDGQPCWAVAVRMDADGELWSGTQTTPTRGAWRKLAELAPVAEADDVDSAPMGTCTACGVYGSYQLPGGGSSYCCCAPVVEVLAAEAAAVAAAELEAAMDAENAAWEAAELEAAELVMAAELEAAGSWCTFPDCIHHLKAQAPTLATTTTATKVARSKTAQRAAATRKANKAAASK